MRDASGIRPTHRCLRWGPAPGDPRLAALFNNASYLSQEKEPAEYLKDGEFDFLFKRKDVDGKGKGG